MQSPAPGQQQQQQQQHQMIVTTGNQLQPATQWVVAAPGPTTVPNYMYRHSTVHGMILIIVGILSIVFNIVDLAVWSSGNDYYFTSFGVVGHGFWCGVMCVIAGGFGIGAGRSRNSSCQIRAFLVLSIIAACFCLGQLITAVIGAAIVGSQYSGGDGYYSNHLCCAGSCSYYDYHSYYSTSSSTTCNQVRTLIAMEALLAILSFIGGIAAISGSVLGCRAACCCSCCCCVDPYPQQFAIIQNNGVPMTIITQQQQQGGQMVPAQYPAQYPMQYPMNFTPAYPPAGGYEQPGYQFTAAPPYYPPPSTALTSPQQTPLQPGVPFQPDAASEPVYKNC